MRDGWMVLERDTAAEHLTRPSGPQPSPTASESCDTPNTTDSNMEGYPHK
jgi:hypothetical protein